MKKKYIEKYTDEIHAERLLGMLNRDNPCGCCPAQNGFETGNLDGNAIFVNLGRVDYCKVCAEFVGLDYEKRKKRFDDTCCPCRKFENKSEAIKRTWLALEQKGYI